MVHVETRMNVWDALAGQPPVAPTSPADSGLWGAVAGRLDPARARPVLRAGIEAVRQVSVRGVEYVMLRSPDDHRRACYLRLTPEEWQLAQLMDGTFTVTRLVAEFARMAGRLAPDQVHRVVADLAGNRMLDELPVDVFRPLQERRLRPLPTRMAAALLAAGRGRRLVLADVDRLVTGLYRAGGRILFTRVIAVLLGLVAVAGLAAFGVTWWWGSRSLFLIGGSYLAGALVLLGLHAVAQAMHELGRALAAKHAGREVPAAGLLVYLGVPSVFVDTTDVWSASRRARLVTTASGPLAVLVLAGVGQVAGLALPGLGSIPFKLAFVCYLNVLISLCPLLPLDGAHLLTDWLEIPHLRSRGLSFLAGRLRGRPPRWPALDTEGRIVAWYAVLAVAWLAVAAGVTYEIVTNRVDGLAIGLWYRGPGGPALLLLIVLGLFTPLVYLVAGGLARWRRRSRRSRTEREYELPRRVEALRASDLGGLPEPVLAGLAGRARWLHPGPGRQLVVADGAATAVYVVREGALHGRRPGDPGGTIRRTAGPGHVVGLASVLTGRPNELDWYTAGTTVLSVPAATVAGLVGGLPGPPPTDRAEAEDLFADTPALAALGADERLALITRAYPVDLAAGAPVELAGPTHAVVIDTGVIVLPDGMELRRGTLVGPVGEGEPGVVAEALTSVRLWFIPDASVLPTLVGDAQRTAGAFPVTAARSAPDTGLHPGGVYPPLEVPPGTPAGTEDPEVDRRFHRRMWWLALLSLLLVPLVIAVDLVPGPAWAEMPSNQALLTVQAGRVTATVAGKDLVLSGGERRYLGGGARIGVTDGSTALLTFPGGGTTILCSGSQVGLGRMHLDATGRHATPRASLSVGAGRLVADTAGTSGAYRPLDLVVTGPAGEVTSAGSARYAVDPNAVTVSAGQVSASGQPVTASAGTLTCAGSPIVLPPVEPGPRPAPPAPSVLPSTAPTPVPVRTTVRPKPATTRPTLRPTSSSPRPSPSPTTARPTTTPPTTPPTTTPPPSSSPPPSSPPPAAG